MLKELVIVVMVSHQVLSMDKGDFVAGNSGDAFKDSESTRLVLSVHEDFPLMQNEITGLKNLYNKQKKEYDDLLSLVGHQNKFLRDRLEQQQQTIMTLQQRITVLENKESNFAKIKKYIPNPFNHYGLLGAGVALSEVLGEHACGYRKFKNTSFLGICGELTIIASFGYIFSHIGRFVDRKCKVTATISKEIEADSVATKMIEALFPTFSAMFAVAVVQDLIAFNPKAISLFQAIICSATSVTTGFSVHLFL